MAGVARKTTTGAAAGDRSAPALPVWLAPAIVVVVAAAAAVGIHLLHDYADANFREAVLFERLDGLARDWRTPAADQAAAQTDLDRVLGELAALDADDAERVRAGFDADLGDLTEGGGRMPAGRSEVEPSFAALQAQLVAERDRHRIVASRTATLADVGTFAALAVAGLGGWLLVRRVERTRRAAAVLLEQQRALARGEERLRASEVRYRTLIEQIPTVTYIEAPDRDPDDWTLHYVSPQIETLLGYTPAEWSAGDVAFWESIVHPDDRDRVVAEDDRTERTGEPFRMEYRLRHRDGRTVWVRDEAVMVRDEAGAPLFWQGVMLDVTAQKEAEAAVRRSEAEFRLVFATNPHPMWIHDRETLAFLEVNDAAVAHYGYARDEFLRLTVAALRPDDETAVAWSRSAVRPEYAGEARHRLKDGHVIDVELTSHPIEFRGRAAMLVVAQDVTARKALEAELAHRACHDALTGLPNRTLLLDRLGMALERAERVGRAAAVLFVDIDDFKVVNDTLGHRAGDELLRQVADRLRSCLRPGETVARLGGDEFTVLIDDVVDVADAAAVAERVLAALRDPFAVDGREVFAAPSIGITLGTGEGDRPDELLRLADVAMYQAKQTGKGRWAVFDPGMDARAWRRLELEAELRRALTDDQLVLHYQPLVDLATMRITEVEALVRWQHPARGLITPGDFIPLAEETGAVVPLGRWVLAEACRQARVWQETFGDDPALTVAVNLSARHLHEPTVITDVVQALETAGLPPQRLTIEVTETAAMADVAGSSAVLRALHALGVRLAIDDFGTGYSALSSLRRCPVDELKIDRSFVAGLGRDAGDAALVGAILAFARTLGLTVTAEGVESATQLAELRALGCDRGQGFYFAESRPAAEVTDLIRASAGGVNRTLGEDAAD